jgi:hypothetical protein
MALIHIFAGLLAIVMGAIALSAAKGGSLHRRSGRVFVGAMMTMAAFGGVMAATHFVATALLTVQPRGRHARRLDVALIAAGSAAGLIAFTVGLGALARAKPAWYAAPALVFAAIAFLAVLGDVRIALGRTLDAHHRIARHLWRMGFAMFIATGSFFLGQAKVFPESIRIVPLLAAPVVIVLVLMFYWWGRVLITKRVPRPTADRPRSGSAPAPSLAAE